MDFESIGGAIAAAALALVVLNDVFTPVKHKQKIKRKWVRYYLRQCEEHGAHDYLVRDLHEHDQDVYFNFLRMTEHLYIKLLRLVSPKIIKKSRNWHSPLSPSKRLTVTLRFLATGDSYESLGLLFLMGVSTICKLIPETCRAIYDVLHKEYIKYPQCQDDWEEIATGFWERWKFPHCLGALDGKHVLIKCPDRSGSTFYNYNGTFSIVLIAMCDASYRFRFINIGCQGRLSDGGVFLGTGLERAIRRGSSQFPDPSPLPGEERDCGYFVIADDAFALNEHLMKPFSHRGLTHDHKIFNYRLSRARRFIENAFGIMCARMRIMLSTIQLCPKNAVKVVLACCALHNMLRMELGVDNTQVDRENLKTGKYVPAAWHEDPQLFATMLPRGRNPTQRAKNYAIT